MPVTRIVIFATLILLMPSSIRADSFAVIFGSFVNKEFAEERKTQLEAVLGELVTITSVEISGTRYYRTLVHLDQRAAARSLLERAASLDVKGGWLLRELTTSLSDRSSSRSDYAQASIVDEPKHDEHPQRPLSTAVPRDNTAEYRENLRAVEYAEGDAVRIVIPKVEEDDFEVRLDGTLDESIWEEIPKYDNMLVSDPDTLVTPRYQTHMRFFNTSKGMYIGVNLEQPKDTLVGRLSSRDADLNRDGWTITLDTSGEGLYGYWFNINLGGSVRDGKVAPERVITAQWDGPWDSATSETKDGWSAELFLPWSMMAMPSGGGDRLIRFWVDRKVAHIDERWSWPALPESSPRFMTALGNMEAPGVVPKRQIEFFPNLSVTSDEMSGDADVRAGMDFSWRPSTDVQITATANPDFGVVESDDVVVNLTAWETFFPEKTLFFLEGQEVFNTMPRNAGMNIIRSGIGSRQTTSTFLGEPTTLLNTRRIGGAPRTKIPEGIKVASVERGKPTDLLGAAKVSGQKGSIRYGVLTAFEDEVQLPGVVSEGALKGEPVVVREDGRDFGVARLLYENTSKGRRSIGYMGTVVKYPDHDAIVNGVDAHWLSPGGALQIDTQLMQSDVDDLKGHGLLTDFKYQPRRGIQHSLQVDYLDEDLNIRDLGFIRRNDSRSIGYNYTYYTGRGLKHLRSKRRSIFLYNEWNRFDQLTRSGLFFRNAWTFKNLNEIRTEFNYFPRRWEDRASFGNGHFRMHDRFVAEIGFGTDTSKKFAFSALLGTRQEELSDWTLRTSLGFSYQPSDRFSLDLDLNYMDHDGWLLHQEQRNMTAFGADDFQPRLAMDVFLSAKQQLRLSLQWAAIRAHEQRFYLIPVGGGTLVQVDKPDGPTDDFALSRLTAQLRYRWEIAPLSDLFIVYTRGSNLPGRVDDGFGDLFQDALDEPIIDYFVIKLRYRFGI